MKQSNVTTKVVDFSAKVNVEHASWNELDLLTGGSFGLIDCVESYVTNVKR